ncbi:hypothetical protein EON66_09860 [archaeon]|nr:MAG: hypothetical protein EON66_09860 [archaeon]
MHSFQHIRTRLYVDKGGTFFPRPTPEQPTCAILSSEITEHRLTMSTMLHACIKRQDVLLFATGRRWRSSASSRAWLERQGRDPFVVSAHAAAYRSRAAYKLVDINARYRILHEGNRVIDLGAAPGGWMQVACDAVRGSGPAQYVDARATVHAQRDGMLGAATQHAARKAESSSVLEQSLPVPKRLRFGDVASMEVEAAGIVRPSTPRVRAGSVSGGVLSSSSSDGMAHPSVGSGQVIGIDLLQIAPLDGCTFVRGDFTSATTQTLVRSMLRGGGADVILSDMAHSFTGNASTDHARQFELAWSALVFAMEVRLAGATTWSKEATLHTNQPLRSAHSSARVFPFRAELGT